MEKRELQITSDGNGILVAKLDRPEDLNPWGPDERESWNSLLHDIERGARSARVLILTGSGRAFSAGGDVTQFGDMFSHGPEQATQHMLRYQEMARLAWRLPIPVIAAVNGLALGGGLAISMLGDLRIASDKARFSAGQVVRGFVPDIGLTYQLPRLVGTARAMEMMLLGQPIDAQKALDWGIVNQVVPEAEVMSAAHAMASRLLSLPQPAIRLIKRTTYLNLDATYDQALNNEAVSEGVLAGTPEFVQSLATFMGKKKKSS